MMPTKSKLLQTIVVPSYWSDHVPHDQILIEILPFEDEYWIVNDKLKEAMPDAHLSLLYRIQNRSLWSYYCFHKDRLSLHSIDHNETDVWHGTSNVDPSKIYRDTMDGFMMQFAQKGLFGRGIYFSDKSSCSHYYSYSTKRSKYGQPTDRPHIRHDEYEMLLAKLLVGTAITLDHTDSALVAPPMMRHGDQRYNTVIGSSSDSSIYVVYENGRAYPSYLVRYYRGKRDPKRTLYANKYVPLAVNMFSFTVFGLVCGYIIAYFDTR